MAAMEGLRRPPFMVQPGENIMTYYSIIKTPIDDLMLVANESELIGIYFADRDHIPAARNQWTHNPKHPVLQQTEQQLKEYFAGKRTSFTLPMRLTGTAF